MCHACFIRTTAITLTPPISSPQMRGGNFGIEDKLGVHPKRIAGYFSSASFFSKNARERARPLAYASGENDLA